VSFPPHLVRGFVREAERLSLSAEKKDVSAAARTFRVLNVVQGVRRLMCKKRLSRVQNQLSRPK
jgi:hypothetical protein